MTDFGELILAILELIVYGFLLALLLSGLFS